MITDFVFGNFAARYYLFKKFKVLGQILQYIFIINLRFKIKSFINYQTGMEKA